MSLNEHLLLQDLYDHDSGKGSLNSNKQKKLEKAKYYRELQKQRELRNSEAGKQQRPICKFYKDGKCAKVCGYNNVQSSTVWQL